jgi:hypothetical protein
MTRPNGNGGEALVDRMDTMTKFGGFIVSAFVVVLAFIVGRRLFSRLFSGPKDKR